MQPINSVPLRARLAAIASGALLLVGCGDLGPAAPAPNHPFAAHDLSYTAGTIRPQAVQAQLDGVTAAFYRAWKSRYVVAACGIGRYYVSVAGAPRGAGGGRDPKSITTSEAHGYGMMLTVLMAGSDPDARLIFDGMVRFFRDHPSAHSPDLMAWNQVEGCGNSLIAGGAESATDGDLDIAYALLLAHRQWGSRGATDYRGEARKVVAAIAAREIDPSGSYVLLGDFAARSEPKYFYGSRSSDLMVDHFRAFGAATGDAIWDKATDGAYRLVNAMQADHSPQAGLLPDFIEDANSSSPHPAKPGFMELDYDGSYYYSACRMPWRLGADYLSSGEPRALAALDRINAWIQPHSAADPKNIAGGYQLSGIPLGVTAASLAFVAPFGVGAMVDAQYQNWLNAIWNFLVDRGIDGEGYYGNTLKLLSMVVMSGNWWSP